MEFEWDEKKNRANIAKHGVSFEQASQIFLGMTVEIEDDLVDYGETRIVSIGVMNAVVILSVVHTDRHGRTRLISARKATPYERNIYETALSGSTYR